MGTGNLLQTRGSWVFLAQANLEEQKEKLYKDLEKGFGKHALVWMVMGVDLRLTFHYVAKGISVCRQASTMFNFYLSLNQGRSALW